MTPERINKPLDERCEKDARRCAVVLTKPGWQQRNNTHAGGRYKASILLALLVCGCSAHKAFKDFSKHDYYGDRPIAPPYCIEGGIVYMPTCSEDGGHQMVWDKNKWVCYIEGCLAVKALHPPAPYCDGKNPCKCEPEANWRYNEYEQRCEAVKRGGQ